MVVGCISTALANRGVAINGPNILEDLITALAFFTDGEDWDYANVRDFFQTKGVVRAGIRLEYNA